MMNVQHLTCDYMTDPLGFDFECPSFGWSTASEAVNGSQRAYQLQIALDPGFAAPTLDTG